VLINLTSSCYSSFDLIQILRGAYIGSNLRLLQKSLVRYKYKSSIINEKVSFTLMVWWLRFLILLTRKENSHVRMCYLGREEVNLYSTIRVMSIMLSTGKAKYLQNKYPIQSRMAIKLLNFHILLLILNKEWCLHTLTLIHLLICVIFLKMRRKI